MEFRTHVVLCWYRPLTMLEREGQHTGVVTKLLVKVTASCHTEPVASQIFTDAQNDVQKTWQEAERDMEWGLVFDGQLPRPQ